ncbi:Zinc finger CCCH domain-containing protein 15 [Nosema bombycis CQ1]|uniref:Zinc finger CCCH domain-containing protein 15 n=1 Tax=Nosema bombycis (strain CQ1 / CVCC 102059) TaxID=578461 RepID=R0KUF1_NOSB1|nr:Zinc finger CCCH domain-containing protein 15 [Nosema bombycis CQ1]|eukprot:EOB13842.1 Zinc finger CCCH domain-containing protein 15 [Nosema bombycis CQ1]
MQRRKQEITQKNLKEMIKELEDKVQQARSKKIKDPLLRQIASLKIKEVELRKEKEAEKASKTKAVIQKIPVGADPKTVICQNFINKCCKEGDKCRFSHENIKKKDEKAESDDTPRQVCRFLIDAINSNEFTSDWVCPFPKCKDIHKLIDLKGDEHTELSLEEYLELSRQSLGDNLTPVTEQTFKEWKEKKLKEEEIHRKKVQALASGPKGLELFESKPEMFCDDEEAGDVDYNERCYSEEEEEVF